MKVYIGYDPRDDSAYKVCVASILSHTSAEVEIIPIKDWQLRREGIYNRPYTVDERGQIWDVRSDTPCSTLFSLQRFAVPLMCGYADEWVLFIDADMMFRDDIAKLFSLADDRYKDTVMDDLYQRQSRAIDPEERRKVLRAFEKRLYDDEVHFIMTFQWNRIVPHLSKVRGWTITPSHFLNCQLDGVWLAE